MAYCLTKIFKIALVIAYVSAFVSVGECREIVFVVNSGQSMNSSDPKHVVQESLLWSTKIFNENDEVGIVAFDNAPKIICPLSKVKDLPADFRFEYSGGSNAGDALLKAIDMLTSKFNSEKSIVVISNGEILLDDSSETLQSLKNFQSGIQQAKWWNIPIYIINLRYYGEPQNFHSFAVDTKEIP